MRLPDAEDLWLACVLQAPTYADHSLVTEQHLTGRGRAILKRIRIVVSEGWPLVTPDQITALDEEDDRVDLRTIPRRLDSIDASTTLPAAEKALLDAWATAHYKQALREAIEICDTDGRERAQTFLTDEVQKLHGSTAGLHWKSPAEAANDVLEEIRQALADPDRKPLGSGMDAVDEACGNYPPSTQTTIGGWTNEGKSTLALTLISGMAVNGTRTAMIQLEDAMPIMARRQLAMLVDEVTVAQRLSDGDSTVADLALLEDLVEESFVPMGMDLLYMPGANPDRVCYAIQEAARRGARVIVVDYLQCFEARQGETRKDALGSAARKMKDAAAQVGAHLILVSQLARPADRNARKTAPGMYMFKETGDIENLSDYALLVWRPDKGANVNVERAKIIIDKSKDGKVGVIDLGWDTRRHLFTRESPDEADHGQTEIGGGGYVHQPD